MHAYIIIPQILKKKKKEFKINTNRYEIENLTNKNKKSIDCKTAMLNKYRRREQKYE